MIYNSASALQFSDNEKGPKHFEGISYSTTCLETTFWGLLVEGRIDHSIDGS